jgi:spermidine/putrescine transport system ATP-binding protein
VYERPATSFVASFLGASNLLNAVVESADGEMARLSLVDGSAITMPADRVPPGSESVQVGVRPEKIRIATANLPSGDATNIVEGTLRVATFIGVSYQYSIEGPGGSEITVVAQNVGDAIDARPGDGVKMVWEPRHTFAVIG